MKRLFFAAFAALALSAVLRAQSIASTWDTLGAGNTYDNSGYWSGSFDAGATWTHLGSSFVASTSGILETFDGAIFGANGGTPSVTLGFYSDNGGQVGSQLLGINLEVTTRFGNVLSLTDIGTKYGSVQLTAGSTYWVMLQNNESELAIWNWPVDANRNPAGSLMYDDSGSATYYRNAGGAMRIGVSAIPEPSTYALALGLLTLGVVLVRRRFRR